MSFFSMVIAVITITLLVVHIISTLYTWLLAILLFINNLFITTFTLMWVLLQVLFAWLQTLFYTCLLPFNTLVTLVWTGIKILFVKFGTFLYKLGSALYTWHYTVNFMYCIQWSGTVDKLLLHHIDLQVSTAKRFCNSG